MLTTSQPQRVGCFPWFFIDINTDEMALNETIFRRMGNVAAYTYLIWGIYGLVVDGDAKGECGNIYEFVFLLVAVCSACVLINNAALVYNGSVKGIVVVIVSVAFFAQLVWLFVIWQHELSDSCRDMWEQDHHTLWYIFMFYFWFTVALLCILGVCLVFSVCAFTFIKVIR